MTKLNACSERVVLGERELRMLSEVPQRAEAADRQLECELEPRHPGPHHAVGVYSRPVGAGQLADGTAVSWWVKWAYRVRLDVVPFASCPSETHPGQVDSEVCTLFSGHPGRHDPDWAVPDYFRVEGQ
ncbi:hypothetical protein ABZY10_29300 [Streptomyces sp. NPDC006539]|uniref:hypothetical protein n=1 Tax=Streptomyces sp. NPDC006539 TaxID=3155352 RepID=UPI00339F520B